MPSVDQRDPNRVIVFDTTLRDGEQAPGFSMGVEQKLKMARALAGTSARIRVGPAMTNRTAMAMKSLAEKEFMIFGNEITPVTGTDISPGYSRKRAPIQPRWRHPVGRPRRPLHLPSRDSSVGS